MNIRARLSLTFFFIVIVVLTASSITIYVSAESNRKADFNRRLRNRALNTARILTEEKEVNAALQRRLEQNNPASLPDQYIIIIDSLGNEIYRSTESEKLPGDSTVIRDVLTRGEVNFTMDNREAIGFVYDTPNGNYIVLATAWDQFGNESITNLRNTLLLTFLAGVVLVSLISWFYAGRILKPIARIIEEVGAISERNLNQRLEEGEVNDELGKLARTFNDMLSRLQNSFTSQKSFIANASHEIKTPITIMSGEIEVALLQERNNEYYIRILKSVLVGLRRLNTLSTQLLQLAESTNQNPDRKFTDFRLDDILWETKELVEKAFPGYQVEIHFDADIDADFFTIRGDEPLVRAAILNLVDNGCKYSPDNHVSIIVDNAADSWITLAFSNAGTIDDEELRKIFSPFFRSAQSKAKRGFGIGLSLVSNVAKLHGGSITVESKEGVTIFSMKLPVSSNN